MKTDAINRLLKSAKRRLGPHQVPTLHERRVEGLEAAERIRNRPKPSPKKDDERSPV